MKPAPLRWPANAPQTQRRHVLGYLAAALPWGLYGCATTPLPTPEAMPPPRSGWAGRLALSVASEPPQHFSARFELEGSALEGKLHLDSPLGQRLASAHWTPTQAWLEQGEQRHVFAHIEALTQHVTGTALPLHALFDWLQGQPSEAAGWQPDLSRHGQGRLSARREHPLPTVQLRLVLD